MADEKPSDPAYDAQAFADELLKMGSFADAGAGATAATGPAASASAPDPASDPNAPNLAELEELLKQAVFDPQPDQKTSSRFSADQALSDRLMEEARSAGGNRGAPLPATSAFDLPAFEKALNAAQASSIDLLRDVDLNVKIELGRSRMLVEDVLKLVEGSVVELDKLAGDPVDVFVNDRLVARGEVLVLNDNFCVRVNEIIAAIKGRGVRVDAVGAAPRQRRSLSILLICAALVVLAASRTPAIAQTSRPATSSPALASPLESQSIQRTRPISAEDENKGIDWPKLMLAMVVVLGLIVALKYVAIWLFPGVRVGGSGRGVRLLSRTAIAPRQQVLLLQVGRRILVVGDSGGAMSPLANIEEPDEVAELLGQTSQTTPATASSRFKAMFGRAERDYDEPLPESLTAADDMEASQSQETAPGEPGAPVDPNIAAAQNEISGLLDRMRSLSKQVKR